jgi:hypothetical protein
MSRAVSFLEAMVRDFARSVPIDIARTMSRLKRLSPDLYDWQEYAPTGVQTIRSSSIL